MMVNITIIEIEDDPVHDDGDYVAVRLGDMEAMAEIVERLSYHGWFLEMPKAAETLNKVLTALAGPECADCPTGLGSVIVDAYGRYGVGIGNSVFRMDDGSEVHWAMLESPVVKDEGYTIGTA